MKTAKRRHSSACRIGRAVGLFLVCNHYRGACAGSSPASSQKGGAVSSPRDFSEMDAATKLLFENLTTFLRCGKSSQQEEVYELHETRSLHHAIVQSIFVNFIIHNKVIS